VARERQDEDAKCFIAHGWSLIVSWDLRCKFLNNGREGQGIAAHYPIRRSGAVVTVQAIGGAQALYVCADPFKIVAPQAGTVQAAPPALLAELSFPLLAHRDD
jgi:hypothetical protein